MVKPVSTLDDWEQPHYQKYSYTGYVISDTTDKNQGGFFLAKYGCGVALTSPSPGYEDNKHCIFIPNTNKIL